MTDIIELVKNSTVNYENILTIEKARELGLHGGPGNGSGDRTKITKTFINTVIYGDERIPMTYPKCFDEHIELSEEDKEKIRVYKISRREGNLNHRGTIGFLIRGLNEDSSESRPIRHDIKRHYKRLPCVKCGTRNTVCDHKNDLYNDPRVLNTTTQTLDDFQPLCNNCNLRKRAVALKRDKEKKRQSPTLDILSINGGIKFTSGDEKYDPNDPNALIGTYWYDPIQFGKDCLDKIQNNS
jgi:5-methylcytosine-specific restriction endonuclease McrA